MSDKVKAATKEILAYLRDCSLDFTDIDRDIEFIIRKHLFPDRTEKLVEAANYCLSEFNRIDKQTEWRDKEPVWWLAWNDVTRKVRQALAEYEEKE